MLVRAGFPPPSIRQSRLARYCLAQISETAPAVGRVCNPPLPTVGFRVVLLNRELEVLRRPERNFPACFDLDRFSGCRIAAHASCALPDLQDPKARNSDSLALLEMLGDEADEVAEERFTCPFR